MTKEEYLKACDRHFHEAKADVIGMVGSLSRRIFLMMADQAWDKARKKYGKNCDLPLRNLIQEAGEEVRDAVTYRAIRRWLADHPSGDN